MAREPVSVVIPTVGRTEMLPSVILGIVFQEYQPIDELILLDEARTPVTEAYAVNQALDLCSLHGIEIKVLRSRERQGIAAARLRLATEAKNELVLMVDDDVVVQAGCLRELADQVVAHGAPWAVPTCFLVSAGVEVDGYIDRPVDLRDPDVEKWTERYPWFVPYFRYTTNVVKPLPAAGTQAILLRRSLFLEVAKNMADLGNLPREDTYMTRKMGPGRFVSMAKSFHFEHRSQVDRGNWEATTFYRLHEAIIKDPDGFLEFFRRTP